jgi:hypothetical protein
MKEATTPLRVSAFYKASYDYDTKSYTHHTDQLSHITASARTATVEDAQALAAQFPKSAKVSAVSLGGDPAHLGIIQFHVNLAPNGNNGGINETGLRRYRTLMRAAAKAGITVEWTAAQAVNSFATQAEFEAAVAGVTA